MKALLFDLFLIHSFDKKINRSSFEIMMKKIIKAKLLHSKILVFLYSPPKTIIDEGHVWAMCVFEFDSSMFIFFDEYSSSFFFVHLFISGNKSNWIDGKKEKHLFFPHFDWFLPMFEFFFQYLFREQTNIEQKILFFYSLAQTDTHILYCHSLC